MKYTILYRNKYGAEPKRTFVRQDWQKMPEDVLKALKCGRDKLHNVSPEHGDCFMEWLDLNRKLKKVEAVLVNFEREIVALPPYGRAQRMRKASSNQTQ
jgi:hypothetical protein